MLAGQLLGRQPPHRSNRSAAWAVVSTLTAHATACYLLRTSAAAIWRPINEKKRRGRRHKYEQRLGTSYREVRVRCMAKLVKTFESDATTVTSK